MYTYKYIHVHMYKIQSAKPLYFPVCFDIHIHVVYPYHEAKRPREKSTKLTSQFHRSRPQSRQNKISEISPGQKCVIQIEMSNSRVSCTWNGARRSS